MNHDFRLVGIGNTFQKVDTKSFKYKMNVSKKESSPNKSALQGSPQQQVHTDQPAENKLCKLAPPQGDLSSQLSDKLQRLKAGVFQLPGLFKQFFYDNNEEITQDKIMKFELFNISSLEELFNDVKDNLTKELIDQNKASNPFQRSEFYEIIMSDLMALITYSRFQVNSLCLVGFDIYIGPYEAILDIISRLNRLTQEVRARLALPDVSLTIHEGKIDKERSIHTGFEYFRLYSICCLLDLNLYFLSEYSKKAAKALDKRCKEIIFTGCYSLISELTPLLTQLHLHSLISSLIETNHSLLLLHPSYDYFFLFGKLPVEEQFQPLYFQIKPVLDKSLLTYTLTPFMFGILRNYDVFAHFLIQVDSKIWVKYILAIIQGIVITIKSGSLRFRQITDLLNLAGQKSYLSNTIFETLLEKLSGPNGEQWGEVDSFFRSAIKSGYNVGVYPAFNRLEHQEIQIILRAVLLNSLSTLENCNDARMVDRWLSIIESDPDSRVHKLIQLLQLTIKKFDPKFMSANMLVLRFEGIPKITLQLREVNRNLHRILTLIKLLQISGKQILENQTFRNYLLTLVTTLHKEADTTTTLAQYLLLQASISRQTLQHNLSIIDKLPLSEEFHAKFLNKFFPAKCDRPFTRDMIQYVKMCIDNGQLNQSTPILQASVEEAFFSEIFFPNKKYLKYTFAGIKTDEIASIPTLSFFSELELCKILEASFTIDKTHTLKMNDHLIDIHYPTTVKTLHDDFVTDIVFFELSEKSKQLLAQLIESYVANFKEKEQFRSTLEAIIARYPIVGYYVLDYPVLTKNLIPLLKDANFPEYMHFGCVLLKLSKLQSSCFSFLYKLLQNRSILTKTGDSLIKALIVPNILSLLCKSIKEASQQPNKQICIDLLGYLYSLIANPLITNFENAKTFIPAALDVIRSIVKYSFNSQVITIIGLFDKFVKLDVGDKFINVKQELNRENMKYSSGQTLLSAPAGDFPIGEIVVLGHQFDQGLLKKMVTKYTNQPHQFYKYTLTPSKINFVTRPQMDRSATKSPLNRSPLKETSPESILDEILGSDKEAILQYVSFNNPNSYSTIYRYPQLSFKQICTCLTAYFKEGSEVIDSCILNYSNTFLIQLIVLDLYLFGVGRYKSYLEVGEQAVLKVKLLLILEKIGLTKVIGLKAKDIMRVPHEISLIQNLRNSDLGILCLFLKKILQEQDVNYSKFFNNFLNNYVVEHAFEVLYDTILDAECINLIQLKLNCTGVSRLSFLIHACPANFRTYIGSLIDGMVKMMMPSKILNYNEYLKLTKEFTQQDQFNEFFKIFKINWEFYGKVLSQKQTISTRQSKISLYYKSVNGKPLPEIINEYFKQIEGNNLNLLASTAELTHKAHLNDTLRRHCELYLTLRSILSPGNSHLANLNLVPPLKLICNIFDSDIVLSDFLVGSKYNSQLLEKSDVELPKNIELWEEGSGLLNQDPLDNELKPITKDIELQQLDNIRGRKGIKFNIKVKGQLKHDIILWRQQIDKLVTKKFISTGRVIDFKECPAEELKQFRLLGILLGNLLHKGTKIQEKFTPQITHYILQKKLPWNLIGQSKDTHNFILDIIKRQTVKDMNLKFQIKQGDKTIELLQKGSEKKVNDLNRMEYCNLMALRLLKSNRAACKEFVSGIYSLLPRNSVALKDLDR